MLIVAFMCILPQPTKTQGATSEPQLIISWQAKNYTPAWYTGRALPVPGNQINATVDLVGANGHIVDLSKTQIYWYVDHQYAAGGIGLQNISLTTPNSIGATVAIEARLPNYQDVVVLKTVSVPVVPPKAVIDVPFPGSTISNQEGILYAWPFFFSIPSPDSLVYTWQVNNRTIKNTESPEFLRLTSQTGKPTTATVNLVIQNSSRTEEVGNADTEVVIGK